MLRSRPHAARTCAGLAALPLTVLLLGLLGCGAPVASHTGPGANGASATQTATAAGCHTINIELEDTGYFEPATCAIHAGNLVYFANKSGIVIKVFVGNTQKFQANPDAPAALNVPGGVTINDGDTYGFSFAKVGTYNITASCSLPMPNMNMTVTVTG